MFYRFFHLNVPKVIGMCLYAYLTRMVRGRNVKKLILAERGNFRFVTAALLWRSVDNLWQPLLLQLSLLRSRVRFCVAITAS